MHNFILFTWEYTQFCERYFGAYIHHAPVTQEARQRAADKQSNGHGSFVQERIDHVREQCALVYDRLGEETVLRWYVEYPIRYGTEFFTHKRIIRPIVWQPTETLRRMYEDSIGNRKWSNPSHLNSDVTRPTRRSQSASSSRP